MLFQKRKLGNLSKLQESEQVIKGKEKVKTLMSNLCLLLNPSRELVYSW